jgi:hypothetical protein
MPGLGCCLVVYYFYTLYTPPLCNLVKFYLLFKEEVREMNSMYIVLVQERNKIVFIFPHYFHRNLFINRTKYQNICVAIEPGSLIHRLINNIDTKAKCRHKKILTFKGTLRPVYIWVYRLEKQSVMLVFSTQLCKLLPLSPSLWFNLPPSPVWKSILCTRIQVCKSGGGYGVLSLRQINTCRKSRSLFLDADIVHCLL